jgi:hypothetical protein
MTTLSGGLEIEVHEHVPGTGTPGLDSFMMSNTTQEDNQKAAIPFPAGQK